MTNAELLHFYIILIGIVFIVLGIYLLLFGTIAIRVSTVSTAVVYFFYMFCWSLTTTSQSLVIGFFSTVAVCTGIGYITYKMPDWLGEWINSVILMGFFIAIFFLTIA